MASGTYTNPFGTITGPTVIDPGPLTVNGAVVANSANINPGPLTVTGDITASAFITGNNVNASNSMNSGGTMSAVGTGTFGNLTVQTAGQLSVRTIVGNPTIAPGRPALPNGFALGVFAAANTGIATFNATTRIFSFNAAATAAVAGETSSFNFQINANNATLGAFLGSMSYQGNVGSSVGSTQLTFLGGSTSAGLSISMGGAANTGSFTFATGGNSVFGINNIVAGTNGTGMDFPSTVPTAGATVPTHTISVRVSGVTYRIPCLI